MTCSEINDYLDDYMDGLLDGDRRAALSAHLDGCSQCRETLRKEQEFRRNLRELPVPPLSPAFPARVFEAAARQEKRDFHRRSFVVGFGSAIAASLALWMVTLSYFGGTPQVPENSLPSVAISVQEVRKVKLVFDAARDLHHAKVSIRLPASVELVGFPGQRVVSWQTDLEQGKNLLALPIRALQEQNGALEARIEYEGKIKVLKVNVSVEKPGVSSSDESRLPMV